MSEPDVRPAGAGVRDDVAQRLLGDPVQAERDLRVDGREVPLGAARQDGAVRTLELGTVGGQGGDQPTVAQHRGMQVVREVTDVLRERGGALVKRPKIRLQLLADLRLFHPMLEAAEGDRHAGQLLAHVVVQVARDPRPLGVLGLDQPAGQVLDLPMADLEGGPTLAHPVFGVPAFGDVDVAADVTREAAVPSILRNARGQKPSVGAVGSAESVLQEECRARLERANVGSDEVVEVIRMDDVQPAFLAQLLERQPRELRTGLG